MRIFLDWYPLHEKCNVELSLVLRALGPAQIKSGKSVDRLIAYVERNREYVPCYALRAQLGLRNSSNLGEKANDLCVADRQKHRGMSWSRDGSVALASIATLQCNGEIDEWCRSRSLSFNWVA